MSHHAVGEKSAQLLQQLLALQLQAALVAVHPGVAQLLQHLAQLLVHLLGASPSPLELRPQAPLAAAALVQEGAEAKRSERERVDATAAGSVGQTPHVGPLRSTKSLHGNAAL